MAIASIGLKASVGLYLRMLEIRVLEDRLQQLCLEGKAGDLHFSTGQEAICVGVCAALRETDFVVTHHRSIAHAVAKGVPLEPLVAEILGKANGMNGGMAGEMHMSYPSNRFMFSWQLVGTCMPVAAGLAWAVKHYLKTDDIVVVFHGDAATANGQWHEGMNLAATLKLPLLAVCENNRLAGNVKSEHYLPVAHVAERAGAYGIAGRYIDGNDVQAVMEAAQKAASYVRANSRPYLLECETTRLGRHKQGQGDLRTPELMAALAKRDPLRGIPHSLSLETEIDEVIKAVQAASDARFPEEPW